MNTQGLLDELYSSNVSRRSFMRYLASLPFIPSALSRDPPQASRERMKLYVDFTNYVAYPDKIEGDISVEEAVSRQLNGIKKAGFIDGIRVEMIYTGSGNWPEDYRVILDKAVERHLGIILLINEQTNTRREEFSSYHYNLPHIGAVESLADSFERIVGTFGGDHGNQPQYMVLNEPNLFYKFIRPPMAYTIMHEAWKRLDDANAKIIGPNVNTRIEASLLYMLPVVLRRPAWLVPSLNIYPLFPERLESMMKFSRRLLGNFYVSEFGVRLVNGDYEAQAREIVDRIYTFRKYGAPLSVLYKFEQDRFNSELFGIANPLDGGLTEAGQIIKNILLLDDSGVFNLRTA